MQAIPALLLALVSVGGMFPDDGNDNGPGAGSPGHRAPGAVPYPGGFFGQAETTVVSVENFRFCSPACRADSAAYVRTPAGPVPGSDNPQAVVYMQPGASSHGRTVTGAATFSVAPATTSASRTAPGTGSGSAS